MKAGTEFTAQRAEWFGIDPQGPNENETEFKDRVSGALRDMGHIIEAHEAFHNQLYDEVSEGEPGPMVGILGAMAQQMHGKNYGRRGVSQVGDDVAVGMVVEKSRPEMPPEMALLALLMGDEMLRR